MKIFSQSTACALIAVANAGPAPSAYQPPAYDCLPMAIPSQMSPVRSECVIRKDGENCETWTYELLGGWTRGWVLPVPEPTCIKPGNTSCYMSLLPSRGKTDEHMTRINCSSTELTAFLNGHGPTAFLGFFSTVQYIQNLEWEMPTKVEKCYLILKGRMIPVIGSCFEAVANNENNRSVIEDLSRVPNVSEFDRLPSTYNY